MQAGHVACRLDTRRADGTRTAVGDTHTVAGVCVSRALGLKALGLKARRLQLVGM